MSSPRRWCWKTVGPVYGEPGVARHWDDPTRAAAEQAAAKTANLRG